MVQLWWNNGGIVVENRRLDKVNWFIYSTIALSNGRCTQIAYIYVRFVGKGSPSRCIYNATFYIYKV